jgi:hypothetical protein
VHGEQHWRGIKLMGGTLDQWSRQGVRLQRLQEYAGKWRVGAGRQQPRPAHQQPREQRGPHVPALQRLGEQQGDARRQGAEEQGIPGAGVVHIQPAGGGVIERFRQGRQPEGREGQPKAGQAAGGQPLTQARQAAAAGQRERPGHHDCLQMGEYQQHQKGAFHAGVCGHRSCSAAASSLAPAG